MRHSLTLVSDSGAGHIGRELVEALARRIRGHATIASKRWLHEPGALDLEIADLEIADLEVEGPGQKDPARLATLVSDLLDAEPLDWSLGPAYGRRKKLLVADMESTIIENELLPELAELAGHGETVAKLTSQAMGGRIDFDESLVRRVALLTGLPADSISHVAQNIRFTSGARILVATMRQAGARTALVSSGFGCFAEIVARELGFDVYRANQLAVTNGKLSGKVIPPILNGETKRAILEELCTRWHLPLEASVTVGDGANDLEMLGAAGLGVAFHGSPAVEAEAPVRVRYGNLMSLLYFQGYARNEFVL